MLLRLWADRPYRATRDLDLLRRGDGVAGSIRADLQTICTTEVAPDGVVFDPRSIRLEARDQVDVQVEDGLARGFADVDADVEAVGAVAAGGQVSASVDAGAQGRSLLGGGVEPRRDVLSRDDEQVAFAHREGVPEGPREAVFEGDAVLGREAEGAGRGRRHRAPFGPLALRVISSLPSRPAATQAAQRQAFTGRRPGRLDWQTGHQWS
jgi:hypothetical protein